MAGQARAVSGLVHGWFAAAVVLVKENQLLAVFLAYLLLTTVFTYPVVLDVASAPAGIEQIDGYQYVWQLWWAKKALIDLHSSPANLTMLYYPYGAYHPLLLSDAFLAFVSLPLVILFGPVVAYNVYFLGSFVLTGFTTYLLCYSVARSRWASFLGGTIFAFVPFRSLHGAGGQVHLLATFWVPLYVLFLFRVFSKPGGRDALLCGVFLALSVLSGPMIVAHAVIPITILFVIYQCVSKRKHLFEARLLKCVGLTGGIAAVMVLPFYYPLLTAMTGGRSLYIMRMSSIGYSPDLLSFVVPFRGQLIVRGIGPLRDLVVRLIPSNQAPENVAYMGLIALLLACIGVWRMRSRVGFWVILALVTGVLALGPLLHVGGGVVEYAYKDVRSYVVLPGAILTKLPFYEWVRGPSRFTISTALCVAVLAAYGIAGVDDRGVKEIARVALAAGLVMLILLECAIYFPFPVMQASVPSFYRTLARDGEDYGILDIPVTSWNHQWMYYQTIHQHGLVGGGTAYRMPQEAAGLVRFAEQLVNPQGEIFSYDFVGVLKQLRIRYVVLHKDRGTDVESQRPFLAQRLGEPVYEDEQIVAFAVPPAERVPVASEIPLLLLGDNWHPIESIEGMPSRWMVNDAVIYVRVDHGGSYHLSLTVHPFARPRHLQVFIEDELVQEYHVGGMQTYVTPAFPLRGGEWTSLRLHVPEGCEVPRQVMEGEVDDRCLSMLFQAVDVFPAEAGA